MKKVLLAIASASTLALSTAGFAGGPDVAPAAPVAGPAAASGIYLTAGAGYGKTDVTNDDPFITDFSNDGFAWTAGVGYQFMTHFAIEGGYIKMPRVKGTNTFQGFPVNVKISPSAIYLAAKGILPLGSQQKADLFAKAGAAYTIENDKIGNISATSDEHKVVPLFGIGGDYYVTNNLAITVQGLATLKSGGFPATYMATAGLTYKFAS